MHGPFCDKEDSLLLLLSANEANLLGQGLVLQASEAEGSIPTCNLTGVLLLFKRIGNIPYNRNNSNRKKMFLGHWLFLSSGDNHRGWQEGFYKSGHVTV